MNEPRKEGYIRTETVPTKAQIATAKELWLRISCIEDRCVYEKRGCDCYEHILAALTAAAEVGCGCIYPQDCADKISATIERCAQVAENWSTTWPTVEAAQAIAAAIRALKDKP